MFSLLYYKDLLFASANNQHNNIANTKTANIEVRMLYFPTCFLTRYFFLFVDFNNLQYFSFPINICQYLSFDDVCYVNENNEECRFSFETIEKPSIMIDSLKIKITNTFKHILFTPLHHNLNDLTYCKPSKIVTHNKTPAYI